jgi:cell division protein FtsL
MGLAAAGARKRSNPSVRQFPRWIKFTAAVVLFSAAAALFTVRALEVYRLNRQAVQLAALKRSLQEQNAVLREEIKLLHTPEYVEKIAREQLGLVKPDEVAVLIVRPPAPTPARPARTPQRRSGLSGVFDALRRVLAP